MAMKQIEFEFPDPDKPEVGVDVELDDGASQSSATGTKDSREQDSDADFEIEVVDDTPAKDRGKKPSQPPEDVTDEELQNYSDKVKKRIQHFSKGFHDERRAKEQALREREALEGYARQLLAENNQLKGSVDKGHNALIESAKKQVGAELAAAKQRYREAYESGDTSAILDAQEALNAAQIRLDRVSNLKPRDTSEALQTERGSVKVPEKASAPRPKPDARAEEWREANEWFGSDDEMTAYALGYHNKLVKDGVDPRSDEYYEKINSRMRKMFPENFDDDLDEIPEQMQKKKSTTVVAPATRSTAPKKVRLTQSQVDIARRLGVSLQDYAKQQAALARRS